jgi:hypothetical protein
MKGPGSFTGLRIGASILNAVASSEKIPIVSERSDEEGEENQEKNGSRRSDNENGEQWRRIAAKRLLKGDDEKIAVPFYHSQANISQPKR